jgi:ribokinase
MLLVIGSANIDLCLDLPTLPAPGETRGGGAFRQAFGGKGANSAVGAAQAGAPVALIACVGRDHYGARMLAQLRAKKVDTALIEESPDAATGVAFIFLDRRAQNMIGLAAGANDRVTAARLDQLLPRLREADVILIQNEVPAATVEHLLALAAGEKWRLLYNSAPARAVPPRLLAAVEWLVLNESEAAQLAGRPVAGAAEAETAARDLRRRGAKNVLITLGPAGVCAAHPGGFFHTPAFPVEAVDTVGAGDIFCGVLAVACAEGRELPAAVRFASAAAALSVTRPGAQDAAPTREEIEAFLASSDPGCSG